MKSGIVSETAVRKIIP